MLEPLLRIAAAVGLHLDVSSSKALADSLDHAVVNILFCIMYFVFCFSASCLFSIANVIHMVMVHG